MNAQVPGLCDDGEDAYALCEVSVFHGRGDEWFVLEWWGEDIGFVVTEAAPTLYACDSGPQRDPGLIAAAPKMAALLLSGWQHVSHGGPTRGDVENVLREAGLLR